MHDFSKIKPLVDPSTPKHLIGREISRKLKLQNETHKLWVQIREEAEPDKRRKLYQRLQVVNDALGIPTESAEQMLGTDAPALPVQEGGAA